MATVDSDVAVSHSKSYINGEWVDGRGERVDVHHPGDGRVVGSVAYADESQVNAAVEHARVAQKAWAAMHVAARVHLLEQVGAIVLDRVEELAQAATAEMGKIIKDAREEAWFTSICFRMFGQDALRHRGVVYPNSIPTDDKRVVSVPVPRGVIAELTPWNFPLAMPIEIMVPALATGNAVIWKPSERVPRTSELLAQCLAQAGLPAGVFQMLQGAAAAGSALVAHQDVAMVSFTGSTAVGEQIARTAGAKKLLLELGGNGGFVVMDDADVDAAVEAAIHACFYLSGQACTAGERLIVQSGVHDEFVEKLAARTSGLRVGDPFDEATEVGPLAMQGTLDKTVRHIEDAAPRGAQIVVGGGVNGLYHDPTVLTQVTPDMAIAQEETFGPVAPVIRFDTLEEAIEIANATPYGLTMAVWTKSMKNAWKLAEGLDAGTVHINESTNYWDLAAPFGGVKRSGVGRIGGEAALNEFTVPKQITFGLDHA